MLNHAISTGVRFDSNAGDKAGARKHTGAQPRRHPQTHRCRCAGARADVEIWCAPAIASAIESASAPSVLAAPVPCALCLASMAEPLAPEAPVDMSWRTEEDEAARLEIFLVTLAPVLADTALAADTPLRALEGVTREHARGGEGWLADLGSAGASQAFRAAALARGMRCMRFLLPLGDSTLGRHG